MSIIEKPLISDAKTAGASFGLGALLLVCGLVSVCLGIARLDPLAGTVATGIFAAALHRTRCVIQHQSIAGRSLGNAQKLGLFAASLGLILTAAAATGSVAGLVGFAGWLGGQALQSVFSEPWIPMVSMAWGFVTGLPAGLIAAERFTAGWWNAGSSTSHCG